MKKSKEIISSMDYGLTSWNKHGLEIDTKIIPIHFWEIIVITIGRFVLILLIIWLLLK